MVELSGLTVRDEQHPNGDIELMVTGLRPGEKLYEELLIGDNPQPTLHPQVMKAHEQFISLPQLDEKLNALSSALKMNDVQTIRALLTNLVRLYQPNKEIVDWVHMARKQALIGNKEN
jgi:FlaA1/EpsC-like NDP-sugar epimerase